MSFFKKIFSSDYRQAVALEGAGKYREAAERYLLAGERGAACLMHRRFARDARDPWERVDALRKAADFAPEGELGSEVREALRGELAAALVALVEHSGVMDRRDRGHLQEAADLYAEGGEHERAGELLARLGYHSRAADAFKLAGAVHRMEEMFRRQEEAEGGQQSFARAWDAYEFARDVGDQLSAVEALARCVELKPQDVALVARLEEARRRLPPAGRVVLRAAAGAWTLLGGPTLTLGREDTCGLLLSEAGVSRLHARLSAEGAAPTVEDLGSSHGTFWEGAPVQRRTPLGAGGELRLGRGVTLRVALSPGGVLPASLTFTAGALKGHVCTWAEEVLTTGIPPQEPAWAPAGLKLAFTRGFWHVDPEGSLLDRLRLNDRPCSQLALLHLGDTLEADGVSLRVE